MSERDEPAGALRPTVLAVGGLDPSGGSGILLDAVLIRSLGSHALPVATSIAVQNTDRLEARHDLPPALLAQQLDTLSAEFLLGAVKTGMLATATLVEALAGWLGNLPRLPVVVDPVLRTASGGDLGGPGFRDALLRHLVPRARVLTPNLDEAGALLGQPVETREAMVPAARALRDLGADWVLLKGGHLAGIDSVDLLAGPEGESWLEEERREGGNVRGTGCALAAALAAGLAHGEAVPEAARNAKAAVTRGLDAAYRAGRGRFLGMFPSRPDE